MIKLNVEEGKTYVFELEGKTTEFDVPGNPTITSIDKSEIHVDIDKFDGETLIFTSKTNSSVGESPDSKVKSITNLKFPPVVNDVNEPFNPISVTIQLIAMIKLRYKVDLKSNNVEFLNRSDVLGKAKRMMKEKGYNEEFIAKGIDFMAKENAIWQRIHEANHFLIYFNLSVKTDNELLQSRFLDKSFQLKENEEFIHGEKTDQPGTTFSKAVIRAPLKTAFFLIHYS